MSQTPRLERAYAALCACGSAVARALSEEQLLDALCGILVEVGGYQMAWVGYAEPDMSVAVRARAGANRSYLDEIKVSWADDEFGRGPTGLAIRTHQPQINRDSRTNPNYGPWREQALRHGFGSSIAIPLEFDGVCFGALAVYAPHPDAFDEQERTILVRFAEDVSFAIGALRARQTLANQQELLRKAATMESLGRLSAGLIHDFNNLLTVVQQCGHELCERLPPRSHEFDLASDVVQASSRAVELARKVLSLGRASTPRAVRLSPASLLESLQSILRRVVGRSIECTVNIESQLQPIVVDAGHFDQVVLNLCVNARDAMPHGGRVAISLTNATNVTMANRSLERAVELCVRDTGSGMSSEVAERIFEPFFTTKGEGHGTGLGLSVVKSIVDHYGGCVSVDSTPGEGSAFRVFLPAASDDLVGSSPAL